jgi:hypothetical protein
VQSSSKDPAERDKAVLEEGRRRKEKQREKIYTETLAEMVEKIKKGGAGAKEICNQEKLRDDEVRFFS